MVTNRVDIPEQVTKDWRLPLYLLIVSIMLLVSILMNFLPAFRVYEIASGLIYEDVSGFVAYFGGTTLESSSYYPVLLLGVSSQVLTFLASCAALAFALLLKLRKPKGKRRYILIVMSLAMTISAMILLFASIVEFREANQLAVLSLGATYHVGLILQAMLLLTCGFIQWFFLIKIRHYIK